MLPTRWSHLARHGLLGSALLGAAGGTAAAEPCDDVANRTITLVLGLQVSPGVKFIGGIEGRQCFSNSTEGMLRLEIGAGGPRLIAGARVRPFEHSDSDSDSEHLGLEAGAVLGRHARFGVHLAGTYGTHSAYLALQTHVQSNAAGDSQSVSIIGGLAPWTAVDTQTVEGRPLIAHGHMMKPRVLAKAAVRDREAIDVRDHYVGAAQLELSSVWTFLRLADELAAVGAPAELIAAALDAADDELRHAEQCAGLAGGLALAALPRYVAQPRFVRRTAAALVTLATEAWCEGCLNETAAAEEARLASGDASGPAGEILAAIAGDEARHAELSWRVLAWVMSVAPELARGALAMVPAYDVKADVTDGDAALARYGVPTRAITEAARAHAVATASARLASLA